MLAVSIIKMVVGRRARRTLGQVLGHDCACFRTALSQVLRHYGNCTERALFPEHGNANLRRGLGCVAGMCCLKCHASHFSTKEYPRKKKFLSVARTDGRREGPWTKPRLFRPLTPPLETAKKSARSAWPIPGVFPLTGGRFFKGGVFGRARDWSRGPPACRLLPWAHFPVTPATCSTTATKHQKPGKRPPVWNERV